MTARRWRVLHLGLLGLGLTAAGIWLAILWTERGDPSTWHKDWYCFYSAGAAFLDSGAPAVYWEQCIDGYFWLYPPYWLYPYALLSSLVPPLAAYASIVVVILASVAFSIWVLGRALGAWDRYATIAMFIIASAALLGTIVTGQHAALLFAGLAGAMWAFRERREFVAGLFMGLMGIKPNWAVVFILWLLITRRWRALGGMASVGVAMIVSTLPLGLEAWAAYLAAAPQWIALLLEPTASGGAYPPDNLVTFEAFTRSTLGAASPIAGKVAWIALEALAVAACLLAWLRSGDVGDQLAVAVLAVVAANVYVEFYDALVLAVPAAVWWTGRDRYTEVSWRLIGVAALGIWTWQWVSMLATPGRAPALVGGFLGVWLAAEVLRLASGTSRRAVPDTLPTPPTPDPASG